MSFLEYQGDPEFRSWLERLVEDKVHEELARERERLFRESFAIISVREKDLLAERIAAPFGIKALRPKKFKISPLAVKSRSATSAMN